MCLILKVYLLIPWNHGKLNFLLEDYTNSLDSGLSQDSSEHILRDELIIPHFFVKPIMLTYLTFTEMGVSRKYHIS